MKKVVLILVSIGLMIGILYEKKTSNRNHSLFLRNVEALADDESINVITCIPEVGSICITDEVFFIMVNHYYSPH